MTRADIVIVIVTVALLPLLYRAFWFPDAPAHIARILHQHDAPLEKSLAQDQRIDVAGDLGVSTLEIKHGQIRFVSSPCNSKICIHSGWIHNSGQILACLPNGILVELSGGTRQYDAINF